MHDGKGYSILSLRHTISLPITDMSSLLQVDAVKRESIDELELAFLLSIEQLLSRGRAILPQAKSSNAPT